MYVKYTAPISLRDIKKKALYYVRKYRKSCNERETRSEAQMISDCVFLLQGTIVIKPIRIRTNCYRLLSITMFDLHPVFFLLLEGLFCLRTAGVG